MSRLVLTMMELIEWLQMYGGIFTVLGALAGIGNFVLGLRKLRTEKKTEPKKEKMTYGFSIEVNLNITRTIKKEA